MSRIEGWIGPSKSKKKRSELMDCNLENAKTEIRELKCALSRARYQHKNRLIKQIQEKTIEKCVAILNEARTVPADLRSIIAKVKDIEIGVEE